MRPYGALQKGFYVMPAKSELRIYMEAHPNASTKTLVEKFGATKQQVYNVRNTIKNKAEPVVEENGPYEMELTVPPNGLNVKLKNGHMIGTIEVTGSGLRFIKSNGKKKPERELSWNALTQLQELGII